MKITIILMIIKNQLNDNFLCLIVSLKKYKNNHYLDDN
jgi:hypothetical protein